MEKEGKMLINKEQNQVYMQKRDIITQPPFILTMSNFCPLLNRQFPILKLNPPIFVENQHVEDITQKRKTKK